MVAGQAIQEQPWAGKASTCCTPRHCTAPKPARPPGLCRAGGQRETAVFVDLGYYFFFATRCGKRINPRVYFIGLMNSASQRLPSLPPACGTARAKHRPTLQSSFISCQQENKEIINRKLIWRGGPGDRGRLCLAPAGAGGTAGGGCRQRSNGPMGRTAQPWSHAGCGAGVGGGGVYSNLYLITLK